VKQYTSCFIGVPLPEKYQEDFEKLLTGIEKLHPDWEIAYSKTPHITVYYLDKQSQHTIPAIVSTIRTKLSFIENLNLKIEGFDYFTKTDPRGGILFLNVLYPPNFVKFNQTLKNKLDQYYSADNNLPFHPHMTIARIKGLTKGSNFKTHISQISQKINKIYWKFPVTEIVLYGVDSTKQPQHQEKLVSIFAK